MKTLALLLALTLGLGACGTGSNSKQALTTELSTLMQQFYDASVKGDTDAMNKILADEFAFSPSGGTRVTKAQAMEFKPAEGFKYTVSDAELVSSTADEAVLNYTENTAKNDVPTVNKRQTAFYKKRDGRWQITSLRSAAK